MDPLAQLLGESPGISAVREQVRRLLQRQSESRRLPSVLILGETGSGKGLLARAMHGASARAGGPFVDVNCAAIPENLLEAEMFGVERGAFTDARQSKPGLFQLAQHGTIFLDEIGLLPEALQAKLLKVIEERAVRRLGGTRSEPVDVWVVAATNEDLAAAIQSRRFRGDLYHRLAVVTLTLPSLRDRGDDLLRLAEHFLARACADYGLPPKTLTAAARQALLAYSWPGNVRELSNLMERVALLCEARQVPREALALPASAPPPTAEARVARAPTETQSLEAAVSDVEREHLVAALEATGWNITQAAVRLGISRNTLRYRIEKHGLRQGVTAPSAPRPSPRRAAAAAPAAPPAVAGRERRRVTLLRAMLLIPSSAEMSWSSHRLLDMMSEKIRSFGGDLQDVNPHGVVAAFGLTPVEDAPVRAAHAASAIVNGVERAAQTGALAVAVRAAIHVADVVVEQDGGQRVVKSELQAAAPTLHALLERAEDGAVLVSESTAALVERRFELEPLTGAAARAYRIVGRERTGLGPAGRMVNFVGRQHELQLLRSRLETALSGTGQLVGISGEAGIGKSRLLHEFRHHAGQTTKYLEAHCVSYGSTVPYLPVLDLVRATCAISDVDRTDLIAEKIVATLTELDLAADAAPYLLHLLGIKEGAESVANLDAEVVKTRTTDILRQMSVRASRVRPLVIVIEDLHWVDRASEEHLTALAEALAGAPILLVTTYRSGYRPPWIDRSYATQIALQPLHPEDSRAVVRAVLGETGGHDSVVEQILAKGEGNPFFLEELARAVREQGLAAPLVVAPDTIKDVLVARIGRLGADEHRVLEAAAAIGKDVPLRVLRAISDVPEPGLGQTLQHLRAGEFLYETAAGPEVEFTFKHALTQEVAYGTLTDDRRRSLHGAIVDAIEKLYADRVDEQIERLAHHAFHGGLWTKAVGYWRRAGAKAAARSALWAAVAYFEGALTALEHVPDRHGALHQAVDVRFDLRTALTPLGEHARIFEYLRQNEQAAAALGDQSRLGRAYAYMADYFRLMGDQDQAGEFGRRALGIAEAIGDVALQVAANIYLGQSSRDRGEYIEGREFLQRAVEAVDVAGGQQSFGLPYIPAVHGRTWLVLCLSELGEFAEAIMRAQEAVSIAEPAGQPFSLASAWFGLGHVHLRKGEMQDAIRALERGVEISRQWHLRLLFPMLGAGLGSAYALVGRLAEAVTILEEANERHASMRGMAGRSPRMSALSEAYLINGQTEAAMRLATSALDFARQYKERGNEAYALVALGDIAAVIDPPDHGRAEANYRAALALGGELEMRPLVGRGQLALAVLQRRRGAAAAARASLAEALTAFRSMTMPLWLERAEAELRALA